MLHISLWLRANGGSGRPHCLRPSLPLCLTNSQSGRQALRLSEGEQSDWVMSQTPLSDHMDWCCARHGSHWLTQQGSSHNRQTCTSDRGALYLFCLLCLCPPPHLCLLRSFWLLFFLTHLSCSVYSLCAFPNTCLFFLPVLFKHEARKDTPLLPSSRFFLNCSLSNKVDPCCVWNYCSIHTHIPTKRHNVNVFDCAELNPFSGSTPMAAHIMEQCHKLALFSVLLCAFGAHVCTLFWQPSSILN